MELTGLVGDLAVVMAGRAGSAVPARLSMTVCLVDADDLPALHGFVHGLRMDSP